jgi:hypothetical protein
VTEDGHALAAAAMDDIDKESRSWSPPSVFPLPNPSNEYVNCGFHRCAIEGRSLKTTVLA